MCRFPARDLLVRHEHESSMLCAIIWSDSGVTKGSAQAGRLVAQAQDYARSPEREAISVTIERRLIAKVDRAYGCQGKVCLVRMSFPGVNGPVRVARSDFMSSASLSGIVGGCISYSCEAVAGFNDPLERKWRVVAG